MADFMKRQEKGKRGEALAAAYLEEQGYLILHRRFRVQAGEIDLVLKEKGTLVFCEVKARNGAQYGTGLEAITLRKMKNMTRATMAYLERYPTDQPLRFDVIEVDLKTGVIHHIKNAFDAVTG